VPISDVPCHLITSSVRVSRVAGAACQEVWPYRDWPPTKSRVEIQREDRWGGCPSVSCRRNGRHANRASVDQVDQHHMRCRSGSSIRAGDIVSLLGGVIDQFLQRIRRKCPPGHDGHGTSATSPMYSNDVRGHAVLPWSAKCPKSTFGAQSKPEFEDPTTMIPWPASGRGHRSSQNWKMYPRRRMEK
jgi:hypothetical protein